MLIYIGYWTLNVYIIVIIIIYVDAVVAVIHVLLFVLHVCMLRECEGCKGDCNAGVRDGGVWLWLWWVKGMWVVHVVHVLYLAHLTYYEWVWCVGREALVECVRCVCVWPGAAWEERGWVDDRIGFGIYQSCGNMGGLDVCQCLGFSGVGGKWVCGLDEGLEGWCYVLCELWVRIICVDGRSRYLYIVLGEYLRILGAPSVQSCCTLSISTYYHVFVYGRYCKSRLVCVWLSELNLSRHHPLYDEKCQPSSGSTWLFFTGIIYSTKNTAQYIYMNIYTHTHTHTHIHTRYYIINYTLIHSLYNIECSITVINFKLKWFNLFVLKAMKLIIWQITIDVKYK